MPFTVPPLKRVAGSSDSDSTVATIWLKEKWYDTTTPWRIAAFLDYKTFTLADFHGESRASFIFRYGKISREDSGLYFPEFPAVARDQYVCIQQQPSNFVELPVTSWVGIIAGETFQMAGTQGFFEPQGDQILEALGLSWLLSRRRLIDAPVVDIVQGGGETDVTLVSRIPAFNRSLSTGRKQAGNRSNAKITITGPPTVPQAYGFSAVDGADWTHRDIIEMLLFRTDTYTGGGETEPHFVLQAQTPELDTFVDGMKSVVETEGRDVRTIIQELLSRKRGLTAKIRWSLDGNNLPSGDIEISIRSLVDSDVSVGSRFLPANPDEVDLFFEFDERVQAASVRLNHIQVVDEIVVKGPPMQTCFSSSGESLAASLNIAEHSIAWDPSRQDEYEASSDAQRRLARFDRVFRMFKLGAPGAQFDWFTQHADPEQRHALLPEVSEAGVVSSDVNVGSGVLDVRVMETIPVLQTADQLHESAHPAYTKPFALVRYLNDPEVFNIWVDVSDPPDAADVYQDGQKALGGPTHTASVTPGDRDLEVDVKFQKQNHVLGIGHFFPEPGFESNTEPVFDFNNMILTMCIESDHRPSVRIITGAASTGFAQRKVEISVLDAHTWVVATGTIVGVTKTGDLQYHQGPRVVRNGMPKLQEVASLAAIYFGRRRQTLSLTKRGTIPEADVGQFVRSVTQGFQLTEINTVVSSVRVDKEGNTVTINTSHVELELSR